MLAKLPTELPNVAKARLPETYSAAKRSLAQCVKIDECRDWANKAEALASYAKQAGDTELRTMADRIQARALDRCGELLRKIPKAPGPKINAPGYINLSRENVARAAGLSDHQRNTALRINAIPRDQFEMLVESDKPPTAKKLAEIGTKKRQRPLIDLGIRTPKEFAAATWLIGLLDDFVREAKAVDVPVALRGCEKNELNRLLTSIRSAGEWLKNLEATVRKGTWHTRGKTLRRK